MNKTVKAIKEEFEEEYQDLLEYFKLEESQDEEFLKKLLEEEVEYNEVVEEIINGANSRLNEMEELLKELSEKYLPCILYRTQIEQDIEDEISDYENAFDSGNQNYIGCFYSDICRDEEDFPLLKDFISDGLVHEDLNHFYGDNNTHERNIISRVRYTTLLSDYVTKAEIRNIIEELEDDYELKYDEEEILDDLDENLGLGIEGLESKSIIKEYIINNHTKGNEEED